MKKTFSKILISVIMVGIFAMPFKANIEIKNREIIAKIEISKVKAQTIPAGVITKPIEVTAALASKVATGGDGYSLGCNLMGSDSILLKTFVNPALGLISWLGGSEGPGIGGCIAQLFFYIWQATGVIARLAGSFLDFFIFYSINDTSYRNDFVTKGWALVRDVANIFLIVALLYVALKTILSLNVSDNKRLIGTIIIVALLINFSLFTTKVVIDASNVIAKIFYTSIVPINSSGSTTGTSGERSISVGLVRKYNPQGLINNTDYKSEGGVGVFIAVTIILIAITLYTAYIFMAVALLFLARVVGLWMSMIFAPIAFASHTVSFKIPGFGHDEFWPELFKNAFLAPIFVFFLYMIVLFLNLGLDIAYTEDNRFFTRLMSVTIPFAILFVLLMTAKKLAVDYSGKIGAGLMSGIKMLGGVAGGMALGATAIAGRQILGRVGSAFANDSRLKAAAANSKFWSGIQKGAMKMESGSFDLRQVKIKGKGLGSLTGMDLGDGKKGGLKQIREDRVKKRQQRAEELKVGEDEPLQQSLNEAEGGVQRLLRANTSEFERFEKEIKEAKEDMADSAAGSTEQKTAAAKLKKVKDERKAFKDTLILDSGMHKGKTMLEVEKTVIPETKVKIVKENRDRMHNLSDRDESNVSNFFTVLKGGSWKANRESSHKIRMGVKMDTGDKH